MHALWIPSWYPADDQDLAGSFFREQLQALAAAGLRVGARRGPTRSMRSAAGLAATRART
ncbi:glycosyltransferase family 4 protein, partial [Buchananella hordeovulneris]